MKKIFEIDIRNVEKELNARFKNFNNMELILSYMKNLFQENFDIMAISYQISNMLNVNQTEVKLK